MSSEMVNGSAMPAEAGGAETGGAERGYAVRIAAVGKCYEIYKRPQDRLKQTLFRGRRNFYREFWALKDVSLDIAKGETIGIIGRNGSGKSTLLQMICGTLTPTTGAIQTQGRVAALLELGAGFHPEFSGRENVYMNARLFGLSREQTDARFDRIASFADIGDFIEQPVKTYSSGMYVRLAFSVIANVDADVLVIDEALAVGDAFFTQKCMRFMRSFKETGTVIFVSHDSAAVLSLCQRACWLDKGRLRQVGAAKAVNEAYLAELFGETNRERAEASGDAGHVKAEVVPQMVASAVTRVQKTGESFGEGGARILGVDLVDVTAGGTVVKVAEAGHEVTLRCEVQAIRDLPQPIVGFYIKDRLGQNLFGQNTMSEFGENPPGMKAGEVRVAAFTFEMPQLKQGQYTVAVAVAEGTKLQHTQHHWIHDAYVVTVSGHGAAATGLVGIPMKKVVFSASEEGANGTG